MDWIQPPLSYKCHVLSETQCVKVASISVWLDEANQDYGVTKHYGTMSTAIVLLEVSATRLIIFWMNM
jgi:hypothetical protein